MCSVGMLLALYAAQGPLSTSSIEVEPVFPARLAAQSTQRVGRMTLVNTSRDPIDGVKIEVRIPRFAEHPPLIGIEHIEPKATVRVPLSIALDPSALAQRDEEGAVPLEIAIEYRAGGQSHRDEKSARLLLRAKGAFSRSDPDSAAAFVDPRSQVVLQTARAAIAGLAEPTPIAAVAALFTATAQLARDRARDTIRFPAETLAGRGSALDLAVPQASLAEALGLRTMLVLAPDRPLVAIAIGLPAHAARRYGSASDFLVDGGELLLPLDPSATAFAAAWKSAAAELKKRAKNRRTVDVRRAWQRFPPIDLSGVDRVPSLPGVSAQVAELARTLARPDEAPREPPDGAAALTNLGNVRLGEGRAKEALELYDRALMVAPKSAAIDIRLDAALAAFLTGDEAAFTERAVACLEAGGQDRLAVLARLGARGLSLALARAFLATGREAPTPPEPTQEIHEPVARFAAWIESQGSKSIR